VTKPPIKATFSNPTHALAGATRLLDRVGREYGLPSEVLTDLRIAMDEVVTNILKYAWRDEGSHDLTIECQVGGGRLQTTIEDDGVAFDPLLAPAPDLNAPMATREIGGLGVHFLKHLMRDVAYERVGGRNRLTLTQDLIDAP
jgi:serine/threonine-protein kinase RsbW